MRRQRPSTVRSSAFLRSVLSFAKTCSIGLRSGEYGGKNKRRAPAARMVRRIALPLCELRLSMTTMSPGRSAGAITGRTVVNDLNETIGTIDDVIVTKDHATLERPLSALGRDDILRKASGGRRHGPRRRRRSPGE
jgi:hypothetical protein